MPGSTTIFGGYTFSPIPPAPLPAGKGETGEIWSL
jgi:hypothetical protein